jgi:hypothetical protein
LQVGQMLALRRSDGRWLLGMIRWLGQDHLDGVWRAGVQYLPGDVTPVNILRNPGGEDSDRTDPGLVLSCRNDNRHPLQLIGVRGSFVPNREFAVTGLSSTRTMLRALRLIDSSRYFERIAVSQ